MRLQTCLAQNGSFSWSGWGVRGRIKGGKGQDYWPSCCIGHLGLQNLAWNEGLMYGHTALSPRVCCFCVGSCYNTRLLFMSSVLLNALGQDRLVILTHVVLFGILSHLSTKDFPHFFVFKLFSVPNISVCEAQLRIFKPHLSSWESFNSIWALEEVFWCNFLSVSFSSWLLSLCTEEPRVPSHEVTLTASWWLLHVSLSWAVEVRNPTLPLQCSK